MGHVSLQFLELESTTKTRDIIFFLKHGSLSGTPGPQRSVGAADPVSLCFLPETQQSPIQPPRPSLFLWVSWGGDSLSSLRQDLLKPKLMSEMHGSSVWTPLVTASGCPVALRSLWKQSVSLNKNSALRNVQRSRALILCCERPLWQTCHYKRDIKHHRATICSLARWSCTQYCTGYGNGIVCRVDHGRPVISNFGADVVWPLWV